MRRWGVAAALWLLSASAAFAACPAVPNDCSNIAVKNLSVGTNATIGGTLGVTGASTFASQATLNFSGTALVLPSGSNATIGGTLGVGSTLTITGAGQAITASGSGNFNITSSANTSLLQIRSPSGTLARFQGAATPVNFFIFNAGNSGVNSTLSMNNGGTGSENFRIVNNAPNGFVQVPGKFRANQVAIDGPIVWSGTAADGPVNNAFYTHLNYSGTVSAPGDPVLNTLNIPSDALATNSSGDNVAGFQYQHILAAGAVGSRNLFQILGNNSVNFASQQVPLITGLNVSVVSTGNMGGTGLTQANSFGTLVGANPVVVASGSAQNLRSVVGMEIDSAITGTGSAYFRAGLSINGKGDNQGVEDYGLLFVTTQPDFPNRYKYGIAFGRLNPSFPMDPTVGVMIGAPIPTLRPLWDNMTVARHIDFRAVYASVQAIGVPGWNVGSIGDENPGVGSIVPTSTGISIDVASRDQSSIAAIVSPGATITVGDMLQGPNGGIYVVNAAPLVNPADLTVTVPDYYPHGSTPSNPVTLTGGTHTTANPTVTMTWTRGTVLALAPAGGSVTSGSAGNTTSIKGRTQTGSATLTLTDNAIGLTKMTASASAPGAGGGKLELVCGTAGGSAKLVAYAGTSGTAVTVLDNIGSGVSGC